MRNSSLLLAIGIGSCTLAGALPAADFNVAAAGQPLQWQQLKYLSLNDADALSKLQISNPLHYQIVRRVLAAANEICDAGKGTPIQAKFDAQDISCMQSVWLTSFPPKRQLYFRIDDTEYSALVVVTNTHAKVTPAH